jgi:hypothetical protein
MAASTYLSAREILRREYGTSRNFLTPHVVTRGKLAPHVAYELSSGPGLEIGSTIFGVSVVRIDDDGTTERLHEDSACFTTLDLANAHIESQSSCARYVAGSCVPGSGRAWGARS